MRALAEKNDEITKQGATLIALTPELPYHASETVDNNEVPFQVLTDLNLKTADEYGLVFDLSILTGIYENFAGLTDRNGEEIKGKLPLTATYIIDPEGVIRYHFIDADYRKRAEPAKIIEELEKVTSGS